MRKIVLLLVLLTTSFVLAQAEQQIQDEIDNTLWKPFKFAFESLDADKLNALYADQVVRVTPNGIDTENRFKDGNRKRFMENKSAKTTIELDFWFDSRHTNAHTSYEVGFYRMRLIGTEDTNTIYGQFHILLRKVDAEWKITQDWDTATINGSGITAADFDKKRPIQFD